jgi:hypothetical protein
VVRRPRWALGAIGFVACEPAVVEIGGGIGFVACVAAVAEIWGGNALWWCDGGGAPRVRGLCSGSGGDLGRR